VTRTQREARELLTLWAEGASEDSINSHKNGVSISRKRYPQNV
jgi:hypothetical protein